jgi:hypothetical protein
MRLIKLALLSFIVFFLIITAMSLLIPSHVRISRAINLKKETDSVRFWVSDTEQWQRWHPAFQGASAANTLAANGISITPVTENDSLVQLRWQQQGRRPVLNSWQIHRFAYTDSVTLQWYMDFHLRWYPWQKFSSLFYEDTYGKMMEQGLANISEMAIKGRKMTEGR